MSLNKCKECGNTVSNQAKTCPHCGARVKKLRWDIVILFALFVGACVIGLPIMAGRHTIVTEQKKAVVKDNVKAIVEDNVRESLNEEYGIQCVSINLLEGTDGSFSGTAKLQDGREIDIDDARIDGEMIRFKRSVKQGYEYKCKHHIDSIKLNAIHDPVLYANGIYFEKGDWCLSGKIWNDGPEPIRGFVVAEFIDDNGKVHCRDREIAYKPKSDPYWGVSANWWIPPNETAMFVCHVSGEVLKSNKINVKLEFFNLGNDSIASYVYDNPSDKSILETIPAKVTSQIYKIQREKANEDAEQ